MDEHVTNCRWQRTTEAECEYRGTHHYCPHPEHACTCPPTPDVRDTERHVITVARALRKRCDAAALTEADGMYVDLDDLGAITSELLRLVQLESRLADAECAKCGDAACRGVRLTSLCEDCTAALRRSVAQFGPASGATTEEGR